MSTEGEIKFLKGHYKVLTVRSGESGEIIKGRFQGLRSWLKDLVGKKPIVGKKEYESGKKIFVPFCESV